MKQEAKRLKQGSCGSEPCITLILGSLCLLVIAIHFMASFFPQGRIWGMNQWAYFSPWVTVPVTFLALLFLLPSFSRFVLNIIKTLTSSILEYMEKRKHLSYLILSLLFFALFWILRTKTHFLGDGYQILSKVESGEFAFKFTEPLESLLHIKAFQLGKSVLNLHVGTLYAILSCVAGCIFVYLSFLFANFLGKEKPQKILVFFILISMGSIQLFFGYVEHYTFLYLFVFGFLFLSLLYLEGRLNLIFPILAFILAFLFHVSALYLLPSLFFLLLVTQGKGKSQRKRITLVAILAVLLTVIMFLGYRRYSWSVPPMFVPLVEGRYTGPDYTLFSLPHLSDFLNQQLLVSPVGLILILTFLFCGRAKSFFMDATARFLVIVALSQLLFNFLIDPGLGASRDWDMFSAVGLGYTVLGLYLFSKLFKDKIKFEYLALLLVVSSLHSTVPWIALNSCEPKTIQRFRNLLLIDPKKSQNGHFVLFKYLRARGQEDEAQKQNEIQRMLSPELPLIADAKRLLLRGELDSAEAKLLLAKQIAPQLGTIYDHMGMVQAARGDLRSAEAEYMKAIRLASFVPATYFNLGNLYLVRGDIDRAFESYKKAVFLKLPNPEAYYNLGLIYLEKGDLDRAEELFKKALRLKSDFGEAFLELGSIYKERRKFQEAIRMYQNAIQLNPDLPEAHARLGMIYLQMHSKEQAIRELERFLELAPKSQNVEQIENILRELRQ
jgi:tetratricopeptide (TPR) repeat protein